MIHPYLGLAVFDVLLCASGYAVIDGLGLTATLGRAWSLGLALLTGWAANGVVLAIAVCFGVPLATTTVIAAVAFVTLVGLTARRVFMRTRLMNAVQPAEGIERAVALGGGVLVAVALAAAVVIAAVGTADTSWDVWAFWLPKADVLYTFHHLDTGPGGFTSWANPEYPPLFPASTAATYSLMGSIHPALLPLQVCLLGVSFIGSVAAILRPFVRGWILYPSVAMLCLAPEFWGRLSSVLPDQVLAYLLAVPALLCVLWMVERRTAWLVLAALLLAAAALTKPEGLMLGLLLVLLVIASALTVHRRAAMPALLLLAGPAAVIPWREWLRAHHQRGNAAVYHWSDLFNAHYLSGRTHRLTFAAGQLAHFVFAWSIWTLVAPLSLVAIVFVARAAPAIGSVFAGWLAIGFAGLLATYWIGTPEIHWYITTSGQRVIATLPLVAGTMLPLLLSIALGQVRRG